jgi:sugar lactone lactonase YvrE
MRKTILLLVLLLIVVAGGLAAFLVVRWTRKPVPTPVGWRAHVTTFAGDGSPVFRDDQQRFHAGFSDPFGLAVAPDGTLYVSDAGESNRIRKINREGVVTTFAGGSEGFADGTGSAASFNTPSGIALAANGNLYVADTGNNRIRQVTPEGKVWTVAGGATAGNLDGPGEQSHFNGPMGVAVDANGNIFVADAYNDRIRLISPKGVVSTIAGGDTPGFADGTGKAALFDTPCGIVVTTDGTLIVADTGNDRLRKIDANGNVSTWDVKVNGEDLSNPIGLTVTHDNYLYVTELDRSRVIQIAPDGTTHVIAARAGFTDDPTAVRFNQLTGIALNQRTGELYVADKVRGSFDSDDSRHHLHSGLDVFGAYGTTVRAVRSEKVTGPLPNWAFGSINEGIRVGVISYIHIHVGRDKDGKMFDDKRFVAVNGADGKPARVRLKRGTRFNPGDAVGTVNRMYHVHLNVGPPGAEINPLTLSPVGFKDDVVPTIEKNGIQLFAESGASFSEKSNGRVLVTGKVRIVVDAFDRTNFNADRRRLGLYVLGYQVLKADGTPPAGFEEPRITQIYSELPPGRESTKVAYADQSGITVYGSKTTKFLYEVTNWVRDRRATRDFLDTSRLTPGDYVLRIIARDYNGNEAQEGRDLLITVR